ncbi:hypothetical protein [Pedococcus sp. 5OH_020]|uniref:hypothetical protein n=1 Tax=Pedococcus sp. 5OH_020 TaxID=2989814 RepID=UPI0022E9C906|nr:hypothetical protein [Pedococcus sp. 5OH_020]
MDESTQALDLLDQAAGHMQAAASLAESLGGHDVFSEWLGFAGQVRLTAAGVSHTPATVADSPLTIIGHLASALEILGGVEPLAGPPDLQLWLWHIRELLDLAALVERA